MSLITSPTPFRERKVIRYLREGKGFRHPIVLGALAFLVVAWIGGTLMGAEDGKATAAHGVATVPSTAAPAALPAAPATSTTVQPVERQYDCQELPTPDDAIYERRDLIGPTYYEVIVPDEYGNTLDFGVAMFENGPVYDSTACAQQELLLGPTTNRVEYLQLCEVKPFPSGHIRYLTAGDDIKSIQVIGPDGLPKTSGVDGFVVNDERMVYDDAWCAELDASF